MPFCFTYIHLFILNIVETRAFLIHIQIGVCLCVCACVRACVAPGNEVGFRVP